MAQWVLMGVLLGNTAFAFWTVFHSERDITASWAWLLVLLVPGVGLLLYAIVGRRMLGHRLKVTPAPDAVERAAAVAAQLAELPDTPSGRLQQLVLRAGGGLVTSGNRLTLMGRYEDFQTALQHDLAHAQHTIIIEAYSVEPDAFGESVRDVLAAKAAEGVTVHVLVDPFGSRRLPRLFWQPLKAAGGHVAWFGGSRFGRLNPRLNDRNHRKIIVVDSRIAYTGGFNLGRHHRRIRLGADLHMRLMGPAARELQRVCALDWRYSVQSGVMPALGEAHMQAQSPGQTVQVVTSAPAHPVSVLAVVQMQLVGLARDRLYIQTPYFIPDDSLLDVLELAVARGVDVRVMIPHRSDQRLLTAASLFYLQQAQAVGVRVFTYRGDFLRSKVVIADDILLTGSANLDPRSAVLNFEVNTLSYAGGLAEKRAAQFITDQLQATEWQAMQFNAVGQHRRLRWAVARLFAPVL